MSYPNYPTMQPAWNDASKRAKEPFLFPIAHDELLRKRTPKPEDMSFLANRPDAAMPSAQAPAQTEPDFQYSDIKPFHVDVEKLIREINELHFASAEGMPKKAPVPQWDGIDTTDIFAPLIDGMSFGDKNKAMSESENVAQGFAEDEGIASDERFAGDEDFDEEGAEEDAVPTHLMATPVPVPTQLYTIPVKKGPGGGLIAGLVIVGLIAVAAILWSTGLLNQLIDLINDIF